MMSAIEPMEALAGNSCGRGPLGNMSRSGTGFAALLFDALEQSQTRLMDDPKTSHPFYWAAFIILGDGAKPLIPTQAVAAAGSKPAGR